MRCSERRHSMLRSDAAAAAAGSGAPCSVPLGLVAGLATARRKRIVVAPALRPLSAPARPGLGPTTQTHRTRRDRRSLVRPASARRPLPPDTVAPCRGLGCKPRRPPGNGRHDKRLIVGWPGGAPRNWKPWRQARGTLYLFPRRCCCRRVPGNRNMGRHGICTEALHG